MLTPTIIHRQLLTQIALGIFSYNFIPLLVWQIPSRFCDFD